MTVEITPEYEKILALINGDAEIIFVGGKAGTGKSTLIQHIRSTVKKNMAIVAPTGVAALNVGGSTIHSFFRFPPRFIMPADIVYDARPVYKKLELLVLDEISMVRADQLDGIDRFLRKNGPIKNKPFGGVQVLMVGDLFQLPPIVTEQEAPLFKDYETPFFFSAHVMRNKFHTVELTKIYRQKDETFMNILNSIRTADNHLQAVNTINNTCWSNKHEGEFITLTAHNATADAMNSAGLAALVTPEFSYIGVLEGNLKDKGLPSPMVLKLKVGAHVMFTKNDEERRWVNGTMGIVTELNEKYIKVKTTDDREYVVSKAEWGTFKYDVFGGKVVPKNAGRYTQYPLTLAWAVTIHKAQGKTLDKIHIDLGSGAFAPGQVYVALSRVRSIDDISLARQLSESEVKIDERVIAFYKSKVLETTS